MAEFKLKAPKPKCRSALNLEFERRLQLEHQYDPEFPSWVSEFRFHATRRFAFDFACPEKLIAIEIDGGQFTRGGHTRPLMMESDREKDALAVAAGWRVARFTGRQMKCGHAIAWARELCGLEPAGYYSRFLDHGRIR